jgi:hypothetical protein
LVKYLEFLIFGWVDSRQKLTTIYFGWADSRQKLTTIYFGWADSRQKLTTILKLNFFILQIHNYDR